MPRKVEDIVVPEKRKSIRNIPIPSRERMFSTSEARRKEEKSAPLNLKKSVEREEPTEGGVPPVLPLKRFEMPPRPGASRKKLFFTSSVGLLIVLFATLSIFSGATLSYTPRSAALAYDSEVFTARKTGEVGLLYSVVKLSEERSASIPASGEQEIERKASGTIVVYNNASTESQRLIENTRFESPDGKVYRIRDGITIPGRSGSTPGSLEVTVYADEPGEDFNISLVDFTVPGLKGTSRYETIYARSKTPMTGGFVGVEKVVSEADLAKAENELKTLLSQELYAEAQAEVPKDFILFPPLSSIVFEEITQVGSNTTNTANINLKANLYGVMFKKSGFARELSKNKATVSPEERVELKSYDSLEVAFVDTAPAALLSASEVSFEVSGLTELLWLTDEAALKSDLAGRSKGDISVILSSYPTIANASATVRPFWKSAFPNEAGKISIKKLVPSR
jgi:hypothetical protein